VKFVILKVYIVITNKTALRSAIVAATLVPSLSMASGYKLNEQSAGGMGTAHAGRAAMAEDASVVFYNPAGMSFLDSAKLTAGFTFIKGDGEFTGSSVNEARLPSSFEGYDNGGDYLGESTIPFFYYANPITEKFAVGLGVFVPFGTNTDYGDNFAGAAFADETSLASIEIAPTFSYKVNDQFSIGGGIDIIYMEGKLTKATDLIPFNPVDDPLNPVALRDPSNAGFENHFEVSGDDWGFGWNIGAFYKLSEATTLGLAYRSEIDITLEGEAGFADQTDLDFFVSSAGVLASQAFGTTFDSRDQAAEVPLTTPESLTLSVAHQATDKLLLQAGATWTGWSSFQNFDVFATENVADSADPTGLGDGFADVSDLAGLGENYIGHIDERWVDVWAVALGGTYQLNDKLALRAGYAFDESPVRDEFRTARVPSSDRQWLTFGAGYMIDQNLSVDVAAGYLYMEKMSLNEVNKFADNTTKGNASVTGEYEIDVFGLSAQVNYSF
jgi:long-chain fatty acid transport protein